VRIGDQSALFLPPKLGSIPVLDATYSRKKKQVLISNISTKITNETRSKNKTLLSQIIIISKISGLKFLLIFWK